MAARKKKTSSRPVEIRDYDDRDTAEMINPRKPLRFEDLGFRLPADPPTKVVSIRLPTRLLNEIMAFASQRDISYQAVIKLFLSESVKQRKRKAA